MHPLQTIFFNTTTKQMKKQKQATKQAVVKGIPSGQAGLNPGGMLPQRLNTRMKYVTYFNIDPGTGGQLGTYVFRANSLFDPDYTSTGHQPLGFDQLAGLYAHYVVNKATARVYVRTFEASNKEALIVGTYLSSSYAPITNSALTLCEQRPDTVTYAFRDSAVSTGGTNIPYLKAPTYDARRFFGCKDPTDREDIGAAVGANPADGAYWIVFIQSPQGYDVASTPCIMHIEYDVTFFEPEEIYPS